MFLCFIENTESNLKTSHPRKSLPFAACEKYLTMVWDRSAAKVPDGSAEENIQSLSAPSMLDTHTHLPTSTGVGTTTGQRTIVYLYIYTYTYSPAGLQCNTRQDPGVTCHPSGQAFIIKLFIILSRKQTEKKRSRAFDSDRTPCKTAPMQFTAQCIRLCHRNLV